MLKQRKSASQANDNINAGKTVSRNRVNDMSSAEKLDPSNQAHNQLSKTEHNPLYQFYRVISTMQHDPNSLVELVDGGPNTPRYVRKTSSIPQRLRHEASMMNYATHPAFPHLCDHWQESDRYFLLLEYLNGEPLEQHLLYRARFTETQTLRVGFALAQALRFLHEQTPAVIYRDLKPANIILQDTGRIRVIDLGCAAFAYPPPTSKYASPIYGAPEIWRGEPQTPACDMYSLGKVLLSMLLGSRSSLLTTDSPNLHILSSTLSSSLLSLLSACMEPIPQNRPSSMEEIEDMLLTLLLQSESVHPHKNKRYNHVRTVTRSKQNLPMIIFQSLYMTPDHKDKSLTSVVASHTIRPSFH
ncbi:MAG: protein kinase [Clostridium sp.]|jgi:serine/threonine protein kinase|nr:protein kinase [Clostridium sp.]